MTKRILKQITVKELLELVTVKLFEGNWCIWHVKGTVGGNVEGNVCGNVDGNVHGNVQGDVKGNVFGGVDYDVCGSVGGDVHGNVEGNVGGYVSGSINGRGWEYIETPKEKLKRLIEETGDEELLKAFNQLEDN